MRISNQFDLELTVDTVKRTETFTSQSTGFHCEWNADTHQVNMATYNPGNFVPGWSYALDFERQFIPISTALSQLSTWSDLTDSHCKSSHTTGSARRSYVAPALRYAIQSDPVKQAKGVAYLEGWNTDQLYRPMSHIPFQCELNTGHINRGTPQAWHSDTQTKNTGNSYADGWNMSDVAHMESSHQFSLAALGHPLGLMNLWLLWRWFVSTYPPGQTFWYNQPRCVMWAMLLCVRAHMVGFNSDKSVLDQFCRGYTPSKALKGYIDQFLNKFKPDVIEGDLDDRVLTDLPGNSWIHNGVDYGKQVWSAYGWQNAMQVWGLVYVMKSSILDATRLSLVAQFANTAIDTIADHASGGSKGLAYAIGVTQFDQATADQLKAEVDAYNATRNFSGQAIEVHKLKSGKYIVRNLPRMRGAEEDDLFIVPFMYLKGFDDPEVHAMWSAMPKPNTKEYKVAYDDVAWALAERS